MKMVAVSTKIPADFHAELQQEAAQKSITVYEVLRERLLATSPIKPASTEPETGEIEPLLLEMVKAQASTENRLEKVEAEVRSLTENVGRLVALLTEEKKHPFGLRRGFVQAVLVKIDALAQGSFSQNKDAWEPFKADAKRRALPQEGGEN